MFKKKNLTAKETEKMTVRFSDFSSWEDISDSKRKSTDTKECYNFVINRGDLEAGYGFKQLTLPNSTTDLTDYSFEVDATEVFGIWMAPIYDSYSGQDKYYVFYLDEGKDVCFFNIFSS